MDLLRVRWVSAFLLLAPACGGTSRNSSASASDSGGNAGSGFGGDAGGGQGNAGDGGLPNAGVGGSILGEGGSPHGSSSGGSDSASVGGSLGNGGAGGLGTESSTGSIGGIFPCDGAFYDANPDPDLYRCIPWTTCVPGTRVVAGGTSQRDRECEPCEDGTFTSRNNDSVCKSWRSCVLGMAVVEPGTSSKDAVCGPDDSSFAATLIEDTSALPPVFATTAAGIFATVGPTMVSGMSFDGEALGTFSVEPTPDSWIESMTGMGDQLYVANTGYRYVYSDVSLSAGTLSRVDASGEVIWEREFSTIPGYLLASRLVNDGTDLYVARVVQPCNVDDYCIPEGDALLVLASFDSDGALIWETTFDAPRDFARLLGFAISDDQLFVGIDRFYGSILDRFDLSGELVDEFSSMDNVMFRAVEADPEGGVMILQYPTQLLRVSGSSAPETFELTEPGQSLQAMLVTEDTVLLAGGTGNQESNVLLMESEKDGTVLTSSTIGSAEYDRAVAIVQSPGGDIFVGGVTESEGASYLFIQPWPL